MDGGKLKYVDNRPIFFPPGQLKYYSGGLTLPDGDNIIKVTGREKQTILKCYKNGKKPCFEEVKLSKEKINEAE